MSLEDELAVGLGTLPTKPQADAPQSAKRNYSQQMSNIIAANVGAYLRRKGCKEARPASPGELDASGAERRMAGGIGAKKVDVTWSTEEAGLLLAGSIKTINFKDIRSANFQKNLTNRRGDMLFEAVTLHRRFPYSVIVGLFCFDKDAAHDGKSKGDRITRRSTFLNAHQRLRLFTGRNDPSDRDEQLEILCLLLIDTDVDPPTVRTFEVGKPNTPVSIDSVIDRALVQVSERNPDFYEFDPVQKQMVRLRS